MPDPIAQEPDVKTTGLLYGLNDKPPLHLAIFVALQHVLAMFVAIVTPPLIIARALKLQDGDAVILVSMALVMSGVGTLIQSRKVGPVGSGLLSVQGTSFIFLAPIISLGSSSIAAGGSQAGALGLIFGMCAAGALVPLILSPFLRLASRVITPLVTGIVVTLIGLTLVEVGITSVGGGFDAMQTGGFGSLENLALAGVVIAIIVILNGSSRPWMRMVSVIVGLAGGYLVAVVAGRVGFSGLARQPWIALPSPLRYGFDFRLSAFLPFGFLYLITAIESIGDLTATSTLTGEPITGPLYFQRLRGGVLADGVVSLLAGVFNSFPSTTFAQNNGVIQLTGVASRHIGTFVGLLLIVLGLFPAVGAVMRAMPPSVLGGATIIMFGTVAVAGIKILSSVHMDRRATTIAAVSFGLGLGVTFVPSIVAVLPPLAKDMFSSGIATGGICALCLNACLPSVRS